jgi:hypothetical protein
MSSKAEKLRQEYEKQLKELSMFNDSEIIIEKKRNQLTS